MWAMKCQSFLSPKDKEGRSHKIQRFSSSRAKDQYLTVTPRSMAWELSVLVTEEFGTVIAGVPVGRFGANVIGPLICDSGEKE